jgi:AAA domain
VRRTGIQIGPLRRNIAAAAIANPVVEKLISPEALSQLLTVGWPITVVPDGPPPGTIGITTNTIGTIWQIFGNSEYGFGRFEVVGPAALPQQQRFRLEFRLLQWQWRLVSVILPENIQNLARQMIGWLNQLQHARGRDVVFVAILERVVDDLNIATWQPQIEGSKTGRELPGIVDEILTMNFVDFGDAKPVRAFVCTSPNPWQFPAKDRSGKLERVEEPNLGRLIVKLASKATPVRVEIYMPHNALDIAGLNSAYQHQ